MQIGDKVAVIDDNLEGLVIQINKNQITFESLEGFRYTYPKEKTVVIKSEFQQKIEQENIKIKDSTKSIKKKKTILKKPVFDLHIEILQPKHHHLSNAQKLEIQLQEVKRILYKMQIQKQKEFILIHGVGAGVLRQKILKILQEKGFQYTDASYLKYGNGALLVLK